MGPHENLHENTRKSVRKADDMSEYKCPPVLICGFNRPGCLKMVLAAVRAAKPQKLFLALDYPRAGRPNDVQGWKDCQEIFGNVDWPCEIYRNYADRNMGCGKRMTSAISWVFEKVDRAIILEDDIVADVTFFKFCAELLERYKDDTRVGMIAGHDEHLHMDKINTYGDSYYFDRMTNITGWATWRRAWEKHDPELSFWPFMERSGILRNIFIKDKYVNRHVEWAGRLYRKEQNTWAGAWALTMYKEHWLSVHPSVCLVTHVGDLSSRVDDCDSTTVSVCKRQNSPFDNRPRYAMKFPLVHPITMIPNLVSEHYMLEDIHMSYWWRRIPRTPAEFVKKLRRIPDKVRNLIWGK